MPRSRRLVRSSPLLLVAIVLASCSSSSSDPPAKPAPPALQDPPAAVPIYDGRTATIPLAVRTSDPSKLTVTVASDGVAAELVPDAAAPSAPSTDGLWHGSLRIRPGYALAAGPGLTVSVDMIDADAQHVVQPVALDVHKLGWQKRVTWDATKGPQTREHGSFFYDREQKAAYLFGGSGYHPQLTPLDDPWRLDLATGVWSPWAPTGDVPVAGGSRRVAAIPGTKKFYAYGGYVGFQTTAKDDPDLYLVDLANAGHQFTRLKSVGDAPARELHALAYDAKGEQLVVFGGFASLPNQDALDDTWLVKIAGDTATWTAVQGKAPSARYGSFSAFDAEGRRFVVWSGGQLPVDAKDPVNAAQDAWALDLAVTPPKWSKLVPAGAAPKGRRNGCSMADPDGRRLFVYGGTSDGATTEKGLYALDLEPEHETWTKLDLPNAPPIRSSGCFGFATAEGATTCAFGNDKALYDDVTFLGYADAPK